MDEEKIELSWNDVENYISILVQKMKEVCPLPDLIVGIQYGGVVPALLLSKALRIPLETMHMSIDDMSLFHKLLGYRNVLFMDDINDSGDTMHEIIDRMRDLWTPSNFMYSSASLIKRKSSKYRFGKCAVEVDHQEWFVFPWEHNEPPEKDSDRYVTLK